MCRSLEPVAGVRALSAVALPVCYWIMDIETIRSMARDRRKRANLKRMRATLQIIRFLHKTCKTRTLHPRGGDGVVCSRLLKAQNGFRMACKKLCFCVVRTQRIIDTAGSVQHGTEELASLQWCFR